ncbi:ClpXP protease specificity-enhancing factor [Kistimonas asteriae]|uniref:ClpXP protease specificity-enhancing factor n=1 Tax=Kistimonas asteriae TaxID=517724 RepID=UPI001FEC5151|nr:ClpXP protease specificity-enhancing factor [Kistimonas asteriae]
MSMTSSRPYIIRALYEWIVDNDCTPYLLVDTTVSGVDVPDQFAGEEQVVLNLAPMAIRDMDVSNEAVMFLARFGGRTFQVCVPVGAVMAIYAKENGQGMVFEVEAQPEGVHLVDSEVNDNEPSPEPDPKGPGRPPKGRPSLKVVK